MTNITRLIRSVSPCWLCLFYLLVSMQYAFGAEIQVRVSANNDDAEERLSNGDMYRTSTDLELGYDGNQRQTVGMRFRSINIPQGATINAAYIEFEVDETDSGTTNVVIVGEDNDDANQFANNDDNISNRTRTSATVNWSPGAWNSVNSKQQTPDIASIIQEIVDRPGWSANNDLVIMIEPGSGCNSSSCQRTAESRNGESGAAPLLVVTYDESFNYEVSNVHGACGVDDLMVVEFDSTIDGDALDTAYYSLNSGTVSAVSQQSDTTVVLTTSGVVPGQGYTLTVGGNDTSVDFTGLTGRYFDQRNGSGTKVSWPAGLFTGDEFLRKDGEVNFSWGSGTPTIFPNVSGNNDRFSVRWSGYLVPQQAGSYEFRLRSDDGVRLDLSGSEIINDWSLHGPRYSNISAVQALNAGQGYEIEMEFFEHTGGAVAQMEWRRNSGSWEVVPSSVLSSCASTSSATLTGLLNVDNQFDAYLSTDDSVQGIFLGSGNDWPTTETISALLDDGQDYYLHIYTRDVGGVAGFLGEFTLSGSSHTFENGSTSLLTNGTDWRVSTTGWSNYQSVSTYGANGVGPWGTRAAIDGSAQWIWSSDNDADNTNYFTTRIFAGAGSNYSVTSVQGACGVDNHLIVKFDNTIDGDALDPAYYSLSAGTISSIAQQDDTTVVLQVTGVVAGTSYILTVDGTDHNVEFAGLTGHYFDQRDGGGSKVSWPAGLFTGTEYLQVDSQVDFNWGTGTPTAFPNISGNNDRFSVRWIGYVVPAQEGSYEFRMQSDDGVRLDFDGTEVITDWSTHAPRFSSSSPAQDLNAGQGYPVEMEYFENTGGAVARLQWRRDGGSWEAIPAASLSSCAVTELLPDPVADYRMDEDIWAGSPGDVVDSSTSPNNANSQNGLNTTATAHLCRAGDFDGVDDYIESAAAGSTLNGTSSLSFWLRTSQVGNNTGWQAPGIAGVEESGGSDDIFWGWIDGSGRIGLSVGNDYSTKSNSVINDNTFHHVVLTRDAITGAYKIYIDGVLDQSGTLATGIIGTSFSSIGRIEDTGGSPEYFQGQLDEVKIYDRVLNDAQVTELYTETRSCGGLQPLAHYAFEQGDWAGAGVSIEDYTGNGNDGISVGNAQSHAEGQVCKGSFIPDNSDYPTIDAINSQLDLDTDVGNQGTILLWYRAEQDWVGSGNRSLIDATTDVLGNANDKYFFLSKQNDGRLRFSLEDSSDRDFNLYTGTNNIAAETWVHVGISWDLSADEIQIYVGGSSAASSSISSNGSVGDVGNIYFGDNSSTYLAPSASAYGRLDEIKIYDSVLSEAEIATAMGDTHTCSSCTLGSFAISQDANGLACPSTRAQVGIQALCVDGSPKDDYVGTVNLSTNDSSSSEFYAAASGGSAISSIDFDGSEVDASKNVYFFHERAVDDVLVTAADTVASVSSTSSSGTDFSAFGFVASSPASFTCGSSSTMTLTAIGQTQPSGSACSILTDFEGQKTLSASFEVNYDPDESPPVADVAREALAIESVLLPTNGLNVDFTDGVSESLNLTHLDAGQILSIDFEYDDGLAQTPIMRGAMSDSFVVSPAEIISNVPSAASCSAPFGDCDVFATVDDTFAHQLEAVCADSPPTRADSYVSSSSISLRSNLVAPLTGEQADILVETVDFNLTDNGLVTVNQTVDEVGVFTLEAFNVPDYPVNVPVVDRRSVSGDTSSNVGRFTPSRFELNLTAGDFAPACNPGVGFDPFTYMNQEFQWGVVPQLTISAVRNDGSVTENYEGEFWKLGASLGRDQTSCVVPPDPNGDKGFCYVDQAGMAATLSAPTSSIGYGVTTDVDGVQTISIQHPLNPNFSYNRPAATNVIPFDADVDLIIEVQDSDDVTVNAPVTGSLSFQLLAELRQGRWKMENAYGPDTQALRLKAFPEYFSSASSFIPNDDDLCTSVSPTVNGSATLVDIPINGGTTTLTVESPLDDAQNENFSFSAPGAGRTGTLSVEVDLSMLPWLQFDWNGDGSVEDHPDVEAQFGQYRGHDRIIYWREVSN